MGGGGGVSNKHCLLTFFHFIWHRLRDLMWYHIGHNMHTVHNFCIIIYPLSFLENSEDPDKFAIILRANCDYFPFYWFKQMFGKV